MGDNVGLSAFAGDARLPVHGERRHLVHVSGVGRFPICAVPVTGSGFVARWRWLKPEPDCWTGRGDIPARGRMELKENSKREERFNRLFDEHFEAVRRYVWRREPSLADDVVAETFLIAWRRLDDVPEAARPWLIGVARNVRLNLRRGAHRQQAVTERLTDTTTAGTATAEVPREAEVVHAALAMVPVRDREVLLLAVWDDLDRAAIAEVLGCSKANASLRLHRARRRFAAAVDELNAGPNTRMSSSLVSGGADV